ncbi:hypothetical protein OSB04_003157 [Centaurea solstitialis]|uniref:Uncharacterized protein n=1 Tax=Centaurea solstitialis TaxID=347529 RepID=A0AA38U4S5_9ASTR|nr:hypothetical protein OSB04_003157 [Centaurea solstitialis]
MVFGSQCIRLDATDTEETIVLETEEDGSPAAAEEIDSSKPLLQEVTHICAGNSKNPGGSKVWVCKHCHQKFTSSYTRIHMHFFGAKIGQKADIRRCEAIIKDREKYKALLNKVTLAEQSAVVSKTLRSSLVNKGKSSSSKKPLEEAFGMMERTAVDLKIVKGLCANGIPFNVLRNPHFIEMVNAIKKAPDGYKPPSSEKARTVLLDECFRDVEKELNPFKDTWLSQGLSIVSDGWSNVKHNPLINVLEVNSRGAMFIGKTGVAIANFLQGAIETVGASNVLQVVTDNAANCKAVGKEIEKVYKHIFWSPCCVHTLNLIFKDLAKEIYWLSDTYKKGKRIVKYFLNHSHILAIFRENSTLELLKVAKTRFASHYILLKRLMDCREALATTISLNTWREWVKVGDENTRKTGQIVVDTIRSDVFWEDVESIIAITKPIFLMIKFCDGEGPNKMGELYEKMDNMLGEIKDVMRDNQYSDYYEKIESIVLERWEKMSIHLHCLGFAFPYYLEKLAPRGIPRKAPNLDLEVMKGVMEAFKRISESEEEGRLLREQFAAFHNKRGLFSMVQSQMDAVTIDSIDWWSTYGSETRELAEVAKKVLSQPISSSSAERNWSTYSYIHNVKRNRLNCKRADKLVFIHSNIHLISRFSEAYQSGSLKKWDVDPENTFLEGSSSRFEEMQWEDLDGDDRVDNGKGKRPRVE